MKRIVATAPAFIYGEEKEVIVPLSTLLKEVLVCYQKCILCVWAAGVTRRWTSGRTRAPCRSCAR